MAARANRVAPPRYLAVVRHGETEVYRVLKEYLEARGLVQVVWDRRVGERRFRSAPASEAAERRRSDRRGPASDLSARTLGFFIARPGGAKARSATDRLDR